MFFKHGSTWCYLILQKSLSSQTAKFFFYKMAKAFSSPFILHCTPLFSSHDNVLYPFYFWHTMNFCLNCFPLLLTRPFPYFLVILWINPFSPTTNFHYLQMTDCVEVNRSYTRQNGSNMAKLCFLTQQKISKNISHKICNPNIAEMKMRLGCLFDQKSDV